MSIISIGDTTMKTKTIELYEFDELPEDVKVKVLEKNREINVDYPQWHDPEIEYWEEKLEGMGLENPKISYSGFYSQGDGASFTCKNVDIEKFLTSQKAKGRFKALLKALEDGGIEVSASVIRLDNHYSHPYTVRADVDANEYEEVSVNFASKVQLEANELENFLTETVRDLSKQIYDNLEKDYEHLTSDEAVIETIKANEYTFRVSGEMENL